MLPDWPVTREACFADDEVAPRKGTPVFAPYCSHCRQRVLLGPRRIASSSWHADTGQSLILRCFCGGLVAADAAPVEGSASSAEVPEEPGRHPSRGRGADVEELIGRHRPDRGWADDLESVRAHVEVDERA